MIPTAFGQYAVIKSLGSGGMADVYLAHDPTPGRQVAIKASAANASPVKRAAALSKGIGDLTRWKA